MGNARKDFGLEMKEIHTILAQGTFYPTGRGPLAGCGETHLFC